MNSDRLKQFYFVCEPSSWTIVKVTTCPTGNRRQSTSPAVLGSGLGLVYKLFRNNEHIQSWIRNTEKTTSAVQLTIAPVKLT